MEILGSVAEPSIDVVLATSWTYPHVGGVSTHMTLLSRALGLNERDVIGFENIIREPEGLWRRGRTFAASRIRREKISIHADRMVKVLHGVTCDVLHCHDAIATWAAGIARERFDLKFKIVSTVHGPVSRHMVEHGSRPNSPEVLAVIMREHEAWRYSDQIIAVDKAQRAICIDQMADPGKISVIPNAVDLDEIDRAMRALRLTTDDQTDWLLVPRRLAPKNGVLNAIEAMRMLPPRIKLWLAGDGIEEGLCRERIRSLSLESRVWMLGGVPRDVVIMLSTAARATLIPSVPSNGIVEATSIAGIEAMACRVPLIASAIGGLLELIEDRKSGLLVPPGEPEMLAKAITRLFTGEIDVGQMTENARLRVEMLYSLPVWITAIKQVYVRAMEASTRP